MGKSKLTTPDSLLSSSINVTIQNSEANSEEQILLLKQKLEQLTSARDTGNAIQCLIGLTDIYRFRGDYNDSFDKLWDALLLAEEIDDEISQIHIHRNLGILYNIFNKDSMAINYIRWSINRIKSSKLPKENKHNQAKQSYFSLAIVHRDNKEYDLALNYLDSCYFFNPDGAQPFVVAEKGLIYLKKGQLTMSESFLSKANRYFIDNNANYQIATCLFLGDLKQKQNKLDSAEFYYLKSLQALKEKKAYLEYKPQILKNLASVYLKQNNPQLAYSFLHEGNMASDSLFNAKSERNNQLFEIKNKYKEALIEKEKLIQRQHDVIHQKNKIQNILSILFGLLFLLGISATALFKLKNRLKKLNLQQQLEKEKSRAILDVKSKELTTYALQLIDKDQALNELLDTIKKEVPGKYNFLRNKYSKGNQNLWEEFNMRFVKVNDNFYERLREKHPNITATEQKHCALIKLHFDSNEMAKILNISVQSVHTSRYRIRKKVGLAHKESLGHYIGSL
ncbi:tetratricopeptide repeat protein [Saccharicrinis sp. 156]|uniref:tetratricopeptide repeat protein n=1 Tax=Saccharicrinis sp. 156 TaxID=3417574 RepID=UPI003D324BE5